MIGRDGSRSEVVEKYKDYLLRTPELLNALSELKDKDLICWCSPEECHADILSHLAND